MEKTKKAIDALTWTLLVACVLGYIAFVAASICGQCAYTITQSQIDLKKLAMAIDHYVIDTGELPTELSELILAETDGWDGPYVRPVDLTDPWGEPIRFEAIEEPAYGYRLECVCQGNSISLSGSPNGRP